MSDETTKGISANEFTFEYNGVQFGGAGTYQMHWPTIELSADLVYEESGRDHIGWDVSVVIRSVLWKGSTSSADNAANMALLVGKMLMPAKPLKVAKGYGFEVGLAGGAVNRDISREIDLYGVKPIRFVLKPLPGVEGCAMEFAFKYRVNRYSDSNSVDHLSWIKGWSHRSEYNIDASGTHRITLTYVLHVMAQATDRGAFTAEEAIRNPTGPLSIATVFPSGFRQVGESLQSSPDKSSATRTIVWEQFTGDSPPLGIIRSGGSFSINVGEADKAMFTNAIATLDRTYEVARQADYKSAPLAFIQEILHAAAQIRLGLTLSGTDDDHHYAIVLASMNITRGRGDDARFWRCSASWILTGCISNLITSGETFRNPPEPNAALWQQFSGVSQYAQTLKLREDPTNDAKTVLDADGQPTTKQIRYLTAAVSPSDAAFGLTCSVDNIDEETSWFYYDETVKYFTDAQVSYNIRMYPNPPGPSIPDDDTDNSTVISVSAGATVSPGNPLPRAVEESGYGMQLIQHSFVGIRFGHQPQVPNFTHLYGTPVILKAGSNKTSGIQKIGSIFGCPVWMVKSTTLYYSEQPINRASRAPVNVTECLTVGSVGTE